MRKSISMAPLPEFSNSVFNERASYTGKPTHVPVDWSLTLRGTSMHSFGKDDTQKFRLMNRSDKSA
jgi:hypothetical protein